MSIEWLLTKTTSTDSQRQNPDTSHKEDRLPDQIQVSKSTKLNQAAKDSSTNKTNMKKGFWGILFGKFS